MAKIRRVIRKVQEGRGEYFDEHLWPVYIALVVLGGFLMGVSAAYQPLSGVPWYKTAWPSLIAIPVAVAAFMVAFRYIDNRLVRRSLQLSVVIAAILHVALVVQLVETELLSDLLLARREPEAEIVEPRPKKPLPEYQPEAFLPEEDRPRQDFEQPLETKTPEPDPRPEEIVRQELPEEPRTPPEPQPVPVPRKCGDDRAQCDPPRAAERGRPATSRGREQTEPADQAVGAEDQPACGYSECHVVADSRRPARASTATIERRATEAASATRAASEPATTIEAPSAQLARRAQADSPIPDRAAQPTLPRPLAQACGHAAHSEVAAVDVPAAARETSPTALAPANTTSTRQNTTSPQIARVAAEPVPEISSDVTAAPARRQSPAESQPSAVAVTPSPVANRQPRATERPDVATTAANVSVETSTGDAASAAPQAATAAARIQRVTADVASSQTASRSASEPRSSNVPLPAQLARASGREGPTASTNPMAAPTLTRATGAPSLSAATQTAEAATGAIVASAKSPRYLPPAQRRGAKQRKVPRRRAWRVIRRHRRWLPQLRLQRALRRWCGARPPAAPRQWIRR